MDFKTFIAMDGYALHVWGAYGISLTVYGALMIHAIIKYDRLKKQGQK
jgi:heme exporter protein CcmD